MKQSFVLAVVMLFTFSGYAQRKGLNMGGNIDLGMSILFADNLRDYYPTAVSTQNRPDFFFSVQGNIGSMFNNHFGLFTGLGVASYQWKFHAQNGLAEATAYQSQTYITLPLYLHMITSKPGRPGFFLNFGASLCMLTGAEWKIKSNTQPERNGNNKEDLNGVNVSPFLNLGLSLPLGTRGDLFIGPKMQTQVLNNFDDVDGTEGLLLANTINIGALVRLGK